MRRTYSDPGINLPLPPLQRCRSLLHVHHRATHRLLATRACLSWEAIADFQLSIDDAGEVGREVGGGDGLLEDVDGAGVIIEDDALECAEDEAGAEREKEVERGVAGECDSRVLCGVSNQKGRRERDVPRVWRGSATALS